ncbi:MAG: hypothetical protein AAF721_12915 [Myxococcota bacterium]
MITAPPSFMSDWGRHSLVIAFRKRWGSFQVATTTHKYSEIIAMEPQQAMALLATAAQYNDRYCTCWAFESLSIRAQGNFPWLWQHVMAAVAGLHDNIAVQMLAPVLDKYVSEAELNSVTHDARSHYLMGKMYSDRAFAAKGSSKSTLQANKKLAMYHLGQAREKCQTEQQHDPGADPYRQAAIAAALAASVAAAYEAAAYLQWKGTRTAALSE